MFVLFSTFNKAELYAKYSPIEESLSTSKEERVFLTYTLITLMKNFVLSAYTFFLGYYLVYLVLGVCRIAWFYVTFPPFLMGFAVNVCLTCQFFFDQEVNYCLRKSSLDANVSIKRMWININMLLEALICFIFPLGFMVLSSYSSLFANVISLNMSLRARLY